MTKYNLCICLLLTFFSFSLKAQDELDLFLQAGVEDAGLMIQEYLKPVFKGVGYGYTNGWYHTAKPHETFGFDISVSANIAFVPQSELTYTFYDADYTNIQLSDPSNSNLPTILGPYSKEERPELTFYNDGVEELRATAPPGAIAMKEEVGFNAVPVPMIQAGIGIIKGTDLIVRFIPSIKLGEKGKLGMFGYGVKHNIAQWIKMLEYAGIDISLLAGFSNLKVTADLSDDNDPVTSNNEGVFKMNGFVLQGIVSKEYINIFTIYGGVGYSRAGSSTQILGTYPIDADFEQLPVDPIDLKYASSSMNLTAGLRIRVVAVSINAAYTLQEYPVLSAGVGFTLR